MNYLDRLFIMSASSVNDIVTGTPTGDVQNSTNSVVSKIDNLGNGGVMIATRVGMFIAVICMIGCGIGLIISNSQKREEAKEKLIWGLIGSIVVFAATGIINLVQSAANGLF